MDTTLIIAALSLGIALFSAILAGASLIWQFRRDFSKRPRLEVHCSIRLMVSRESGIDQTKQLFWSVVNAGQDDIKVADLVIKPVGTSTAMMVINAPVPQMLKHGESFMSYDRLDEMVEQLKQLNSEAIEHCTAIDTLGREWPAPAENIKRINSDIQKILHPEKFPAPQTG